MKAVNINIEDTYGRVIIGRPDEMDGLKFGTTAEVYIRRALSRGEGPRAEVNWSAIGTVDPDTAEEYAETISAAADLAARVNYLIAGFIGNRPSFDGFADPKAAAREWDANVIPRVGHWLVDYLGPAGRSADRKPSSTSRRSTGRTTSTNSESSASRNCR